MHHEPTDSGKAFEQMSALSSIIHETPDMSVNADKTLQPLANLRGETGFEENGLRVAFVRAPFNESYSTNKNAGTR